MLDFEHATVFAVAFTYRTNVAATCEIRGITKAGHFNGKFILNNDNAFHTETLNLPDIPIFIEVVTAAGTLEWGQILGRLVLRIDGTDFYDLCQGVLTSDHALAWPATNLYDQFAGHGQLAYSTGVNPAAGAEISNSVPTGYVWKIMAIRFALVTDANVANRRVHFQFWDNGDVAFEAISPVDQVASTTRNYSLAPWPSSPVSSNDDDIQITIPKDMLFVASEDFISSTVNLQVGDNFSAPHYRIEQFKYP